MALPFLLAGIPAVLVATGSFWSPEKRRVTLQQSAALRTVDPRSQGGGKASESRGGWLAVRGARGQALPLSHPGWFCARQKQKKAQKMGVSRACGGGMGASPRRSLRGAREKCVLRSSGCRENLCGA